LRFLTRTSKKVVILSIVAGLFNGICNTALIALINARLSGQQPYSEGAIGLTFVGLCMLMLTSKAFSQTSLIYLAHSTVFKLRMQLSRQILATPFRQIESVGAPALLAALTTDVLTITDTIAATPIICINIAILLGCLIYMQWLSLTAFVVVALFIAGGVVCYQLLSRQALGYLRQAREEYDALAGHFRALTEGTKELKLHRRRRETFLDQVLYTTSQRYRQRNVHGMTIYTIADVSGQMLFYVLIGLLIFVLPRVVALPAAAVQSYTLLIIYMMVPLTDIMNHIPLLGRAEVALKKLERLGLALQPAAAETSAEEPAATWRSLELVGVTHTYYRERENSTFLLGPIDLRFTPGEVVFLIGGNGSGKTSLAKLLTGLYTPEAGQIRLDQRPIDPDEQDRYRQNFSAVFSDFYLFERLLGFETTGLDARARQYLEQLQLNHKVQIADGAFSTTALSQGQRKRLALLTAYLEDRPFYVFDEWAADQDPTFKEVFYTQILADLKRRGKTVLVITHDDSYFHLADRLVKLEHGQLRPAESAAELGLPEYAAA
jgi:putative ATP-binding cassette transporter